MKSYEEFMENGNAYDNDSGFIIQRSLNSCAWNVKEISSCQRVLSTSTLIEDTIPISLPTAEELEKTLSERRYMPYGENFTTCQTTPPFANYQENCPPGIAKGQLDENYNTLPGSDQDALNKSSMRPGSAVIITTALSVSPKTTYQLLADKPAPASTRADFVISPTHVRSKPKKPLHERNIKIVDVESVSGYRGKDPVDMLVKYIESDVEEKPNERKANKLNAEKKKERKKKYEKMTAAKVNAKLSEAKNTAKTNNQKQQPMETDTTSSEGEVSDLAEAVELPQIQPKKSSNKHTNVAVKSEFHKVLPRKESKKPLTPAAVVYNQETAKPVGISYVQPKHVLSTTTKTPQNKIVGPKMAKSTSVASKTPKGVVNHINSVNKRNVLGLRNQTHNNTSHAKADNVVNIASTPDVMAKRKLSSGNNENIYSHNFKPTPQGHTNGPVYVSPPREFNGIELLADTAINLWTPQLSRAPMLAEDNNPTTPLTTNNYNISNMEKQFPTLQQAVKLRKMRVSPNKISPELSTKISPKKSTTNDIIQAPVVKEEAIRMKPDPENEPEPVVLAQAAQVESPVAAPPEKGIKLLKKVPKRPAVVMLHECCDTTDDDDDLLDDLCFGDFTVMELKMILSDSDVEDETIVAENANGAMPCVSQFLSNLNEQVKFNENGSAPEQEQLETCQSVENAIIAAARANQQQEEWQQPEPVIYANRRHNNFQKHNIHIVEYIYTSWLAVIDSGDYTYCRE